MSVTESVTALGAALDQVLAECDDGDLTALANGELLDTLRDVEAVRNRISVFDHGWVRAAEQRALASTLAAKTTKNLLATTLRLSSAEAGRRVRGAAVLSPRSTLLGVPLPPIRPVLAEAQRAGQVTPEQADPVLNTRSVGGRGRGAGGAALVGYVGVFTPRDLARVGQRITDALYPDGTLAEDTVQRDRASFTDRLPEWIPPEHVDQHRTPLRNTRIRGKSDFALA